MWRSVADLHRNMDVDAAIAELRAQVEQALVLGIDVTHVDTHMGTVMHRRLIGGYVELALEHEVPVMFPRLDEEGWRAVSREHPGVSLDDDGAAAAARLGAELEERGVPTFDAVVGLPLESGPSDRVEIAKRALGSLPEGLSHLIIHAATDTPELRAIAPDWRYRVADREAFLSPDLRDWIRDRGLVLLGYEPLRRLMPRRRR